MNYTEPGDSKSNFRWLMGGKEEEGEKGYLIVLKSICIMQF